MLQILEAVTVNFCIWILLLENARKAGRKESEWIETKCP